MPECDVTGGMAGSLRHGTDIRVETASITALEAAKARRQVSTTARQLELESKEREPLRPWPLNPICQTWAGTPLRKLRRPVIHCWPHMKERQWPSFLVTQSFFVPTASALMGNIRRQHTQLEKSITSTSHQEESRHRMDGRIPNACTSLSAVGTQSCSSSVEMSTKTRSSMQRQVKMFFGIQEDSLGE